MCGTPERAVKLCNRLLFERLRLNTTRPANPETALQVFFIAGEFLLVLVSVVFPAWRAQAAAAAVLTGALLLLWPVLPESGRWLLAHGRKDEAMKVAGARAFIHSRSRAAMEKSRLPCCRKGVVQPAAPTHATHQTNRRACRP
jgi:hypothetical protein